MFQSSQLVVKVADLPSADRGNKMNKNTASAGNKDKESTQQQREDEDTLGAILASGSGSADEYETDVSTKNSFQTESSQSEIGASKSWSSDDTHETSASRNYVDENTFFGGMLDGLSVMFGGGTNAKDGSHHSSDDEDDKGTYDEAAKPFCSISNKPMIMNYGLTARKKNVKMGNREFMKDDSMSVFSTIDSQHSNDSLLGQQETQDDFNDSFLNNITISTVNKINYNSEQARLYRAIDTKNWESASYHLTKNPSMARSWVFRRSSSSGRIQWVFLPIHAACFSDAPAYLIRDLVRSYPDSAKMTAAGQKLPLHIACETGAGHETVSYLVNVNQESLYHVDSNGNTPLQLCVFSMSGKNRDKVMKILTKAAAGKKANQKFPKLKGFLGRNKGRKSRASLESRP